MIELFPDKLSGLPTPLFNNLMASLEYGIKHDISDVNILTLHAIAPVTIYAFNLSANGVNIDFLRSALQNFLQELLNCLLFQHLDTNIVDAASDALLALICVQRVSTLFTHVQIENEITKQISLHKNRISIWF